MEERRKFKRYKVSLNAALHFNYESEPKMIGQVVDFSREGLRVSIAGRRAPDVGIPVQIQTYLPGQRLPVKLEGRAKWVRRCIDACEVGCQLDRIAPEDKSEILDYAYSEWRKTALV